MKYNNSVQSFYLAYPVSHYRHLGWPWSYGTKVETVFARNGKWENWPKEKEFMLTDDRQEQTRWFADTHALISDCIVAVGILLWLAWGCELLLRHREMHKT